MPVNSTLKRDLDILFLKLFRLKNEPICVTCNKHSDWSNGEFGIQLSHFISRQHLATRWDFENVFPQCETCNQIHTNNPKPLEKYIILVHGIERVERLKQSKYKITKLPNYMLQDWKILIQNDIDTLSCRG